MRKLILSVLLVVALAVPALAEDKVPNGCDPLYQDIADNALVSFEGTGDLDVLVVTDPLCWHCRLGHKLLSEYPEKYRTVKLSFFPRRTFIGSDMAAWILEDAVGKDDLLDKLDFAYKHLKQPKTDDVAEARMVVLSQFIVFFPQMLGADESIEALYARLQKEHEPHTLQSSALAHSAKIPGTPVLVAGEKVLIGYGAGPWLKALDANAICK
ncbi:hypothetical protein [Pseudodesulfovibrio sp. zrk46]|uniref:DsbA family protein n=1 Tax=Pseudodesulfovibrio sp. zrk46 TaxID=2725288 RepID=UPI0014493C20|nr:hypothetical protein [Pseudodesulfovibrio sp. zrk46]QJB55126.1 hypothetical protein HFN16_01330 [Pseudodesulfovibrio sp. zrk46]